MRHASCFATARFVSFHLRRAELPQYCDPDIYGVWEEMAFPRSNVTADLSDEDAYPYAIAQFRLCAIIAVNVH